MSSFPKPCRARVALLLVLWLCIAATLPALAQDAEPVLVRISPDQVQVPLDQALDLAVEVADVEELYAFDVSLHYDPEAIDIVDGDPERDGIQVALGLFLEPGLVARNQVITSTGTVNLAMTQIRPSEPKSGTGVLFVVSLLGKTKGSTTLTLDRVTLARRDGSSLPVELGAGEIQIGDIDPTMPTYTPIPTQGPGTPIPSPTATATGSPSTATPVPVATSPPTVGPATTDAPNQATTATQSVSSTEAAPIDSGATREPSAATPNAVEGGPPDAQGGVNPSPVATEVSRAESAPSPVAAATLGVQIEPQPNTNGLDRPAETSGSLPARLFLWIAIVAVGLAAVLGGIVLVFVVTGARRGGE